MTQQITEKDWKAWNEALGIESNLPDGEYVGVVMQGNGHPRAELNKKTGLAQLFFMAKVSEGPSEGRTQSFFLRFAVPDKTADGQAKDPNKLKQANGFVRKQARDTIMAMFGDDNSTKGMLYSLLPIDGDNDRVLDGFKTIAGQISGRRLAWSLSTKVDEATKVERQNATVKPAPAKSEFAA